jgi:ATP-binding cassette, subfamily B, bacterial MsbA
MPQIQPVIATLLRFAKPYRWKYPLIITLGLAASIAEGFGIGLLIPLLDAFMGSDRAMGANSRFTVYVMALLPDESGTERLVYLGIAVVLLVVLRTIVLGASLAVAIDLVGRTTRDLRMAACRKLLWMDYAAFAAARPGNLLNVMDAQTDRTSDALLWLVTSVISLCTVVVFFALLVALSWELAVVVGLFLAPAHLAVQRVSRAATASGRQLVDNYFLLIDRNIELVNSMRTVRAFNQERFEQRRFDTAANNLFGTYRRTETLIQLTPPVAELLYVPAFLAVFAYAWLFDIPAAILLVFMLLLYRMQPALKRLDQARVTLSSLSSAVSEVDALLHRRDDAGMPGGRHTLDGPIDRVSFESVSFSYRGHGRGVLHEVSFDIRKGEVLAIVGKSGSGKSTIVNLLLRLFDPDVGQVRVNGRRLDALDVCAWRSRLALAGQDAELLSGSIRDNIVFGLEGISTEDIRRAIERAGASDLIARLPDGLDTVLASRGAGLSGGERQRIALARALLRKPEILILDEATNAVDSATEGTILDAVAELRQSMAVILITHRLPTIAMADRALLMADGRVVAEGDPAEILAGMSEPALFDPGGPQGSTAHSLPQSTSRE